jgi:Zn finger protein HypA/HybF involved in hydrogenase expression
MVGSMSSVDIEVRCACLACGFEFALEDAGWVRWSAAGADHEQMCCPNCDSDWITIDESTE